MDYPKHNRHSIRLQGYDYAQPGAYFITIVAHDRQCLFGEIENGEMRINECGKMAQQCWLDIPNHFPQTQLDEYIIMPDHIHGIIIINDSPIVGAKNFSPNMVGTKNISPNIGAKNISPRPFRSPSQTIGSIVRGFKIGVTKWIHQIVGAKNFSPQSSQPTPQSSQPTPQPSEPSPQPNVWQRNYYEHIIRNDDELHRIRQYIRNNPQNWRGS